MGRVGMEMMMWMMSGMTELGCQGYPSSYMALVVIPTIHGGLQLVFTFNKTPSFISVLDLLIKGQKIATLAGRGLPWLFFSNWNNLLPKTLNETSLYLINYGPYFPLSCKVTQKSTVRFRYWLKQRYSLLPYLKKHSKRLAGDLFFKYL